jgi:dihydroflavonol-4-reductase
MRAFVTGGTGFAGSHLIDVLLREGHEVTALVRARSRAVRLIEDGVRIVDGDLDDKQALVAGTEGQDVVFHLAGLVAARNEQEYMHANRDGTRHVVDAARVAGISRVIHVSSLAAAGPSEPGRPLAGHEASAPVTAYGRSKLASEEVVTRSGLPWTIVRPPMVYGPRDTQVFKVFKVARKGIVPAFGSKKQELSAIYAPDLADALVKVAAAPGALGRTYYACHPRVFTSEEFARAVGRAVRRPKLRVVRLPDGLTRGLLGLTGSIARLGGRATILNRDKSRELLQAAWTCDPSLLKRDTGWEAVFDIGAGTEATAAWCRENGWL